MKKVLVMAAALALIAAPALALIDNTKHDLSSSNTANSFRSTNVDEICVFCHTPHGAAAANFAPLWNRATVPATAIYGGVAIDATYDLASYNVTDAPLCLSCHDGANLTSTLNNPPNSLGGVDPTWNAGEITSMADLGDGTGAADLSNDHPIGFDYAAVNALDDEIRTFAAATANGVQFFDGTDMWCSSCHDVHGAVDASNVAIPTFLIKSNAQSKLCLACHIK